MTTIDATVAQQALDAFNLIFASTPPYTSDGGCTFSDKAVSLANKAILELRYAIAKSVQPPRKALSDAELCVLLVGIDPETKRLPSGFRRFAHAIEAVHGIGAQE